MRKRLLCSVQYNLDIEVKGPLLIKSGAETLDSEKMTPVLTFKDGGESAHPYIPGTSLKGVMRSHIERIARALSESKCPVCLPYLRDRGDEQSCGVFFEKTDDKAGVYKGSCLACRLFGSLQFRGRTSFNDAYASEPEKIKTEVRNGVAIDRKTGGAAGGALYNQRVVTAGSFQTSVGIENFEAWQLGLMTLALRDLEAQRLPLGMGTSRGLGQVEGKILSIELRFPFNKQGRKIQGIGSLATVDEIRKYGLYGAEPAEDVLPEPLSDGLWDVYRFETDEAKDSLLKWSRQALSSFLREYRWDGASRQR